MALGDQEARPVTEVTGQRRDRGLVIHVLLADADDVGPPDERALGWRQELHRAPRPKSPEHPLPADGDER